MSLMIDVPTFKKIAHGLMKMFSEKTWTVSSYREFMIKIKKRSRFSNPKVLTEGTLILGVPMKQWHQVFTKGLDVALADVKNKIDKARYLNPNGFSQEDLLQIKSQDVASAVKAMTQNLKDFKS